MLGALRRVVATRPVRYGRFPRKFSSDPSPLTQTTIDPNLDLYKVVSLVTQIDGRAIVAGPQNAR